MRGGLDEALDPHSGSGDGGHDVPERSLVLPRLRRHRLLVVSAPRAQWVVAYTATLLATVTEVAGPMGGRRC
jgi:hypothetical protein